jgi:D-methionine transport system ATP-binding protein
VFAAPREQVTKRFIATSLPGLPEESLIDRLHAQWPGRIVTVLIRQRGISGGQGHALSSSGQNISRLIAKYGVESSLLHGGIDTVRGSAIGAITYEFNGPGWHVNAFLKELAANSDVIDFGVAERPVAYADAVKVHDQAGKGDQS